MFEKVLLVELEDSGLVSRAYSRGRYGYGKEYKLKMSPEIVGPSIDNNFYDSLVQQSKDGQYLQKLEQAYKAFGFGKRKSDFSSFFENM